MCRSNGVIKRLLQSHSVQGWDSVAHREVHAWAGWLARLPVFDSYRVTHDVVSIKTGIGSRPLLTATGAASSMAVF